ncbi:MAG: hypothetical protein IT405_02550 [Candidatus Yanofskybacteria bacterium]|nr:hypothetical protein [Candidatus Yanofskybacteria bacterium]
MSEHPPQPSAVSGEQEPASYERALDAVRAMRANGVSDPFDDEDERVLRGLELFEQWYHERGLHMRGIATPEKAVDIIRATRVFLDAGYTGKPFVDAALEKLRDEFADAQQEGVVGVADAIGNAIDVLEAALPPERKERPADILATKMEEARRAADTGKARDAVGILSLALIDPRFKRLPKAVLATAQALRDELKQRM